MIPSRVNIGGHNYSVEENKLECAKTDNTPCLIDYYEQKIFTDFSNNAVTMQEQGIAHEVLHGLLKESGFIKRMDQANIHHEELPTMLENIFWRFLKDNTNFFDSPSSNAKEE